MKVAVHIRAASSAAEANRLCRLTPAYRQILNDYPATAWNRKHVRTAPHHTGPAWTDEPGAQREGAWTVEFEVEKIAPK